jgi:hypothetical protein
VNPDEGGGGGGKGKQGQGRRAAVRRRMNARPEERSFTQNELPVNDDTHTNGTYVPYLPQNCQFGQTGANLTLETVRLSKQ